jgi:hypothetical protein
VEPSNVRLETVVVRRVTDSPLFGGQRFQLAEAVGFRKQRFLDHHMLALPQEPEKQVDFGRVRRADAGGVVPLRRHVAHVAVVGGEDWIDGGDDIGSRVAQALPPLDAEADNYKAHE